MAQVPIIDVRKGTAVANARQRRKRALAVREASLG
jgi:hypothetical protein